jgi:hypothetical protein
MMTARWVALGGLVSGVVAAAPLSAQAQAKDNVPVTLKDLRPPASPAFTLMGIEPQSIERPRTPRVLGASVLQATNDFSTLPRNFALEVAPFWLTGHRNLEFKPDGEGAGDTFLQTLTFSVATATDSGALHTSVGIGFRTLLARGHMNAAALARLDTIGGLQRDLNATDDSSKENQLAASIKEVALRLQDSLRVTGFRFEVAGAVSGVFDTSRFDSGHFARLGLWITPSYQLEKPALDVTGLVRVIINKGDRTGTLVDYGGRLSYDASPLTLSCELLGRASIDATITRPGTAGPLTGTFTLDNTYRLDGSVEYAMGPGTSLGLTFGRNFVEAGNAKNLIATATINLGFGALPIVLPQH